MSAFQAEDRGSIPLTRSFKLTNHNKLYNIKLLINNRLLLNTKNIVPINIIMLTIRLSRIGKKKKPMYRLIISEKARDPYGKALEILGSYNPFTKDIILKKERILYWIKNGAGLSATVNNLLVENKVISNKKVTVSKINKKKKEKKNNKENKKTEKKDKEKTEIKSKIEEKTEEKK